MIFVKIVCEKSAVKTIKSIIAVDQNDYNNQLVSRGGTKNWVWITVTAVFFVILFAIIFIGSFVITFNLINNMNYTI